MLSQHTYFCFTGLYLHCGILILLCRSTLTVYITFTPVPILRIRRLIRSIGTGKHKESTHVVLPQESLVDDQRNLVRLGFHPRAPPVGGDHGSSAPFLGVRLWN